MAQPSIHRFVLCLALVCVALAALAGAAAAAKPGSPRPVVSPKPGQSVGGTRVRLVVRAGPERGDLKARLNGVSIGRRFAVRDGERRRVLEASSVDGLRRGRNVLRIWVARRGDYRRATVHFKVAHRRPLASAGIDRRVVVGSRSQLRGLLRLDKSDPGRKRLRWDVVKAPARSILSPSRPAGARASAAAAAEQSALGGRRTLTPTFRPDVRGRYRLRLTATSGNGTSSDVATVYAVPPNPLIVIDTSVPATAQEPRPGIQVGGEVLRAPYMRTIGTQGLYAGSVENVNYWAMWQLVTYDRVTMALKWNRTYGLCSGHANLYACTIGADGKPHQADLAQELAALGPETLVVAASHPGGARTLYWGPPGEDSFLTNFLTGIGLPSESQAEFAPQLAAAKAGEMAAVGSPGLAPGDARFTVGGGQGGLNGYLTPDSNPLRDYFYLPSARAPFDTRFASSCNGQSCTVAQKVGEIEVNGTVGAGQAGFLVSGFDRHTLAPVEHAAFTIATGSNEGAGGRGATEAGKMTTYLNSLAGRELLAVVTSIHGPAQSEPVFFTPGTPSAIWQALVGAIVALGGTREGFNTAATTLGSDYTLIGHGHLGEGAGDEFVGAGARMRGAMVPDSQSLFGPQGITYGETPPAELVMQTVLAPPRPTAWPLEGNAEAQAAIKWIGEETHTLGNNPRSAYATQLTTATAAAEALTKVKSLKWTKKSSFGEKTFIEAQAELATEIEDVGKTRTYMLELAQPAKEAGNNGWEEAIGVSKELEEQIKKLKEEGKVSAEYLSVVEEVLETISLGFDAKGFADAAKFLTGAAIAAEAGQTLWGVDYNGVPTQPGVGVKAVELAKELRRQAEENEHTFQRMGDIIVSDWTKLSKIGPYANCDASDGGCGKSGEYDELSYNQGQGEIAVATMKRSFDRDIYEQLVPLSFPIWNTGLSTNQEAKVPEEEFQCGGLAFPFYGAPQLAYHRSLWEFNPENQLKTWRIYLSVARSELTYGWAPETMLKRMFEPVSVQSSNAAAGGLGIDPGHFMREGLKIREYVSGISCAREPPRPPPVVEYSVARGR